MYILSSEEKKKPTAGDLHYLLHILTIIHNNGLDKDTVNQFIDLHLKMNETEKPLRKLQSAVRKLYDGVSTEIAERLLSQGGEEKGDRIPDMTQPKYKVSVLGELTGYARQTVNNWTEGKGGYLRAFKLDGSVKFVLEEDLVKKLRELGNFTTVDEAFRRKHEYKVKL